MADISGSEHTVFFVIIVNGTLTTIFLISRLFYSPIFRCLIKHSLFRVICSSFYMVFDRQRVLCAEKEEQDSPWVRLVPNVSISFLIFHPCYIVLHSNWLKHDRNCRGSLRPGKYCHKKKTNRWTMSHWLDCPNGRIVDGLYGVAGDVGWIYGVRKVLCSSAVTSSPFLSCPSELASFHPECTVEDYVPILGWMTFRDRCLARADLAFRCLTPCHFHFPLRSVLNDKTSDLEPESD